MHAMMTKKVRTVIIIVFALIFMHFIYASLLKTSAASLDLSRFKLPLKQPSPVEKAPPVEEAQPPKEQTKPDSEAQSELTSEVSPASGESSQDSTSEINVDFDRYFDAHEKGLMVLLRALGKSTPESKEGSELKQLLQANKETKKFKVAEIESYDYSKMLDQVQLTQSNHGMEDVLKLNNFQRAFIEFVEKVLGTLDEVRPSIGGINNNDHYAAAKGSDKYQHREGRIPVYGGHWREFYLEEPVRTLEYLLHFFRITDEEKTALQKSHRAFLESMPQNFPAELLDAGKKFGFMEGDGIVYLGGGKYNQLVLLSISLLRQANCKLPIEVIIPKREDYDIDLCNKILPSFNGRCKVMSDFLPSKLVLNIGSFQLKSFAILVSSFKNVLYLDADNLPAKNPDYLFVNKPFTKKHMVLWPDLWRRSTSPSFYDIADIDIDPKWQLRNSYFPGDERGASKEKISLHDAKGTIPEASSETGQLLINKEVHFKTLILSLYYNYYGPDYYYPLFSQGAAGEGDKETFVAAAHKLDLPYYQVGEFNREFGPLTDKKKREYFGMGQYDPIVDYLNQEYGLTNRVNMDLFAKNNEDPEKLNYDFHYYKTSSLMFLHANWPKYYFDEMFGSANSHGRGPKDLQGNRRRLYTEHLMKETHGYDFEVEIMKHANAWFCKSEVNLKGLSAADSHLRKKNCESMKQHLEFLLGLEESV